MTDPATPFLCNYPKKIQNIYKDVGTPMFTAALFMGQDMETTEVSFDS